VGDRRTPRGNGRGRFGQECGRRRHGQCPGPVPASGPGFHSDGIGVNPVGRPKRVRVRLRVPPHVPVLYRIIVPEPVGVGIRDREPVPEHIRDREAVRVGIRDREPVPEHIRDRQAVRVGIRDGAPVRIPVADYAYVS
jgi:hypothetical protein